MVACPSPFATSLLVPSPPVPVSGRFLSGPSIMQLDFDLPLQVGSFSEQNWTIRALDLEWSVFSVTVPAGNPLRVVAGVGNPVAEVAPPSVSYSAGIPDLVGQDGSPVAPFTDFPLAIV